MALSALYHRIPACLGDCRCNFVFVVVVDSYNYVFYRVLKKKREKKKQKHSGEKVKRHVKSSRLILCVEPEGSLPSVYSTQHRPEAPLCLYVVHSTCSYRVTWNLLLLLLLLLLITCKRPDPWHWGLVVHLAVVDGTIVNNL